MRQSDDNIKVHQPLLKKGDPGFVEPDAKIAPATEAGPSLEKQPEQPERQSKRKSTRNTNEE